MAEFITGVEAIAALKRGDCLWHKDWEYGDFIYYDRMTKTIRDEDNEIAEIDLEEFMEDNVFQIVSINRWKPKGRLANCYKCNGTINSFDIDRFKFCPYCGTKMIGV